MKDQVALVTGGSMGMGEAAVRKFAKEGASVAIVDINLEAAQKLSEELNAQGYKTIAIQCDVSKESQVEAMVKQVVDTYGKLDAAFNNAGIQLDATDITEISEEDYDRILNVNLKGVWLCTKHELKQMGQQQSGAIVNNSSIAGVTGSPERSPYAASKHGVIGLTKSVAMDYATKGVRANVICPGIIETPMVKTMIETGDLSREASVNSLPMKRLGRPDEVASTVYWLCNPEFGYVTGQVLPVDGGYTIP